MEITFLIFALLKGSYSLFVGTINYKNLLNKTVKLSDVSNEKLSASIKYRITLATMEVFGTCFMLTPPILGV